jgi:hypothetical protein
MFLHKPVRHGSLTLLFEPFRLINCDSKLLPWPIFCQIGPLKAVVKLFKVRKIGAKLIFFLSNIDSPYQKYAESTTPRITDAGSWRLSVSVMRGVDGSADIRGVFQKVFRRGRGCLHILSFFLSRFQYVYFNIRMNKVFYIFSFFSTTLRDSMTTKLIPALANKRSVRVHKC